LEPEYFSHPHNINSYRICCIFELTLQVAPVLDLNFINGPGVQHWMLPESMSNHFRRIQTRWEKKPENHIAFHVIGLFE
jgi:hypothetical protein